MKKIFTLEISPISIEIEVTEGLAEKDALKLAEKETIKKLSKKFPYYKYSVVMGNVIADEDVKSGRPVKLKDSGEVGIIYEIKPSNKFPIKIAVENGKMVNCTKSAIEKISKKTNIHKLIKGRDSLHKSVNEWGSGCTGFFVNGEEIIPVIIEASGRSKMKAVIVGHDTKGSYYSLNAQNLLRIFDTLPEVEEYKANFAKK